MHGGEGRGTSSTAPQCPERYTEAQAVLHSMFMEESGWHMLDSGDAYGRIGDGRRARRELLAIPKIAPLNDDGDECKDGECKDGRGATLARISTFHALDTVLEYSAELDSKFERFCAANDDGRMDWTDLALKFADAKDSEFEHDENPHSTYNIESPLDSQFRWIEFDANVSDKDGNRQHRRRAVLVQMHLGCDMRGGYGRPRAFTLRDDYMDNYECLECAIKSFDVSCSCTHIECIGYGMVHNESAESECEACAFGDDRECSGPRSDDCICSKYPACWKATGKPDGSVRCKECGGEVEVR